MAAANTLPRMALEEVRRHVVEEREARRAAMLERLGHIRLGKLQRRLARFARKLEAASTDRWRDALRARLVKRSKGLANAVEKAGQMYSPEALHRVRIAAKKLRYTLEMAFDAGVRPAGPLVTRLKRVQDSLGRLHDLQVLLGHVAEVQAAAPGRQLPKGSLDQVAQALERECRHLHAQYVAAVPRLLELTRVARREIAPALVIAAPAGAQPPGGAGASPSQT
jgi:CHAD domain-containing protein